MKKLGFFGGSFNPPTIAHEIIAKDIAIKFDLDKVYFVPVGNFYSKADLIDARKRFEMLNLITDSNIDVLDIELKAKKSLQTIDAFNLINNKFNLSKNYFILGGDNLEKLPNWENAEKCLNSNIIAIFPDHGSRYMSKVFSDDWMNEQGFFDSVNEEEVQKIEFVK